MIRNDRGDHFLLIVQHDHALLAGQLAERMGNRWFDGPDPRDETLLGVQLHDAGWPMHDDAPTLNADGLPLDVLETPMEVAFQVWRESARIASDAHPYAGLLVSLHIFRLSSYHVPATLTPMEKYERRTELFLVNQFQQNEIERQEQLRPLVGLPIDRPLQFGLADPGVDPHEDRLRFNASLLRLMDAISLEACCGRPVFTTIPGVCPRIGSEGTDIAIAHPSPDLVTVDPWPFAMSRIELEVPARRLPKTHFATVEAFRQVCAAAPPFAHRLTIRSG